MKLNRFVQRDKPSPIHSSGFVQRTDRIGSTAVDPFTARLNRERARQLVGGYRDAQVLSQHRNENRDKLSSSRRGEAISDISASTSVSTKNRGSRIDVVRPSSVDVAKSAARPGKTDVRHTFREPPSRHRS